ncbi:ABC transporter permease [Cohnella suwonensis]|uniref:ABC transporter permease n=1 Tax=Cohnella suwonensis TaxID=696072 RepID=A0ABW0LV32_9BACL
MISRLHRAFYLYWRHLSQQLKAILEYQTDFFILVISAVLTQLLGIVFLKVVYTKIPDINGWQFWEVAFMYAMIYLTEGIGSLFFEGTWRIGSLVNRGGLDVFLLRPLSPILQVLCNGIGMNGLGNIAMGSIIVVQAIIYMPMHWTWDKIAITILLLLSAVVIRVAINLASNSVSFWTRASRNAFPLMVHNLSDFAKYPITIFPVAIRSLVTFVVPFAFVSFFPASYIFGKNGTDWLWALSPIVAVACAAIAYRIFALGLRTYESVGN